jgi:hypothetical protein
MNSNVVHTERVKTTNDPKAAKKEKKHDKYRQDLLLLSLIFIPILRTRIYCTIDFDGKAMIRREIVLLCTWVANECIVVQ